MTDQEGLPALVPATPVLVGLSGGLDSVVLLHRLTSSPTARERGLRAIHVHHGLHAEAERWSEHCASVCAGLGVPLIVARVQVMRDHDDGIEAAARAARYGAFAEQLRAGETLALAHHRDDQAETVLLRLLRASGGTGLAAMRSLRPFERGWLWRPWLDTPRAALLTYAQSHDLSWIEDPSNLDSAHDRNFLRHQVFPVLRQRWPQAEAMFARSAALLAEQDDLLRVESQSRLAQVRGLDGATLSVSALCSHAPAWRARIVRLWIEELGLPPLPGQTIAIIDNELLPARPDAEAETRWQGAVMRRWRDLLQAELARPAWPVDWRAQWNGKDALALPGDDRLCFEPNAPGAAPETSGNFLLRARRGGERIRLPGRDHSHELKKLLQELGVPPWERERLPLLFAQDGELLAAGDLVISARLDSLCREQGLRLVWERQCRNFGG